MATNPYNLCSGSSATLAPIVPEDALPSEPEVQDSQSVHNTPAPSDNTTAMNTQIQLAKIQLTNPLLPAPKHPRYEKRVKDKDLYRTKDYPHYWQYVHQIEQLPMELRLEESNRYLDYLVAEPWTAYCDEKSMEDTWDNQKAFLESQLGDHELLAQIGNEAKDYHQIQLMVFFKGLDQALKQKICGHPVFPNSREDLVTLAKKLRPSIGSEPHSWATTANAGFNASTSAKTTKRNDRKPSTTTITTKLPELEPLQDTFFDGDCNYCGKHGHKELDCLKKKSDNTMGKTLPTGLASGSNHIAATSRAATKITARPKPKKGRPLPAVLDSASDLNLLRKDIVEDLSLVFDALPLRHAGGDTLRTYSVYHKVVEVQDSFGVWRQTCKPFTSADLEMPVILGLPWLQRNNPKVDFTNLSVQWRSAEEDFPLTQPPEETTIEGLTRKLEDLRVNYIVQGLQVVDPDDLESSTTLIPEAYQSLAEVFSEAQAETLPPHRERDHSINLLEGTTPPFGPMYNLSAKELAVLREYLDINLANGFIQPLRSSAEAPVLFAPKGDGGLWLCVFTKIDVKNVYYRIRIWEGDEWKTAFGTREESQHEQHVRIVLEALLIAGLFAKLSKCLFSVKRMPFLGYVITDIGVEMEMDRIFTIVNWPETESVHEVQTFLGFVNSYRRFIQGFSRIAAPLIEATKGSNTKLKKELVSRRAGFLFPEAQMALRVLVRAFTTAPFLQHFDVMLPIRLKTDASGYTISGILSQKHPDGWRVTAYFSQKMIPAERKYETHDGELLAILKSFRHWRHYLEGSNHPVEVLSDYLSLRSFMTTHKLSQRQVRWALSLSAYDFIITYRKGILNPADGPSQRPDHQREADQEDQMEDASPRDDLLAQDIHLCELLVAGTTSPRQQSQRKQASEAVSHEGPYEEVSTSLIDSLPEFLWIDPLAKHMLEQITAREANPGMSDAHPLWSHRDDLLYFDSVLYIPYTESLRLGIIKKHHDEPLTGHLATEKTFALICAKYYWPDIRKQIQEYCNSYLVCQGAWVICGKQPGLLQLIPIPKRAWEVLTLDFITGLPESYVYGGVYNGILVVVCKFSKMAHYIPARKDWTAGQLAEAFVREIIRLYGVPQALISDCGSVFTSRLWANLMFALKINCRLSTAFHPQTDGQTERQNSTLEQYLQSYVNYQQDNWASLLALAKFAYNASLHSSTGKAPFEVVYGSIPRSDMLTAEELKKYSAVNGTITEAKQLTEHLCNTRVKVCRALAKSQEYQARHYNKSHLDVTYKVGQLVWLKVKNITMERPSRKLDWQCYGFFRIVKKIGNVAYQLNLPEELRIHDVFHVSLLRDYKPRAGEDIPEPEPLRLAEDPAKKEWEVEAITAS
ncbi:Ribonuclease H-like domain [Lasallia pustulata]|uniref:RNA-directed DNA polymerase n=1 Tax=Lasallia pustulata TaxID=136370 RepID=A0A1W5CZJ3_9LECA|nr:Ribonuclease H-like domain [Lasallia pustulata]